MRVVAGKYRGRVLNVLSNEFTRPTTDKGKETLFNSLGQFFDGGIALDLFGGTGSLGIEALSRGMDHCYFSELNPDTYKILKSNLSNLKIDNATAFNGDYKTFLQKYKNIRFDLVMLDPPYKIAKDIYDIVKFMLINHMFKDGCQVVLEMPKDGERIMPEGLEFRKEKTGAASRFIILEYKEEK